MEGQQRGEHQEGLVDGPSFTGHQVGKTFAGSEAVDGLDLFFNLACRSSSLKEIGCALAWTLITRSFAAFERGWLHLVDKIVLGNLRKDFAMLRGRGTRPRSPFPLPLGRASHLHEVALRETMGNFCQICEDGKYEEDAWLVCCVGAVNGMAGNGRAISPGTGTAVQIRALEQLSRSIQKVLSNDCRLIRTPSDADRELSSRFLTYTGEEVPKMQILSVEQAEPALPPASHGGSINAVDFVSPGTRRFLEHPEENLLNEVPSDRRVLQAKVHIQEGDKLKLAKLLVSRKVCTWVKCQDVLTVGNVKILNGLFGVGKGKTLPDGREIQRVIMNLIPSNMVLEQARGSMSGLPSITQYLSLVLDREEEVHFFQSDMSSAFYLFALPRAWSRFLCFNLAVDGSEIGMSPGETFYLGCGVIPMGWSSAVSIMQEIADRLATIGRLPDDHKVRRDCPLPPWLVDTLSKSNANGASWFHVYLDNFCSMEKTVEKRVYQEEGWLHSLIEKSWGSSGVLSSSSKRVVSAGRAVELGAEVNGIDGSLGPTSERLLKLLQSTLSIIRKCKLNRKWVQVVAGRWVHILAFRRPGMVIFDVLWKFISRKVKGAKAENLVRSELFHACLISLILRGDLRAGISEITTASDASEGGGAVGFAKELTEEGAAFAETDRKIHGMVPKAPILVLSLFNGVGCAFRCYDLVGISPEVAISFEINPGANRVTARRWPNVVMEKDVRNIDENMVRKWKYLYPLIEAIHVWAGFPCVDLSSVKFGRKNLEGSESGLFFEVVRILKLLRKVYGFEFDIKYFAENVASMDVGAEQQISQIFGRKPFRVDSSDVVPIHRPRFCWTNVGITRIPGVELEEKPRWVEVSFDHSYPPTSAWLEEECVWEGGHYGVVFPTCLKSIVRQRPPPAPAGLSKCDNDTVLRWQADAFRFPPYQYHEKYLIWHGNRWRLLSASERELLHGLGFEHTALCWSAGEIKQNPTGFEDARKTLVGDGFNCFTFAYFAAQACMKWIPGITYDMLWDRMGLAPGMCTPLFMRAPLRRSLVYCEETCHSNISDLHKCLLRRVNHTGSDVRVSSGFITNPKAFPRQSAAAGWWLWRKGFAYRWQHKEHINALELRSLIHALEYRAYHFKEVSTRVFHLTDSYVVMSVVSKGRSSSRILKPLLRRLSALLLSYGLYLVVAHVESTENPTDGASRA